MDTTEQIHTPKTSIFRKPWFMYGAPAVIFLLAAAILILPGILKNPGWKNYTPSNSELLSERVTALAGDPDGSTWIGTDQGISRLDKNGQWTSYPMDWVYTLAFDSDGQLWAGGRFGLKIFGSSGQWMYKYSLPQSFALAFDEQGTIWIGAHEGLLTIKQGDSSYTKVLPGWIRAIAVDPQGRIWVGGDDGLKMRSLDGSWISYQTGNSGPAQNDIEAIALDSIGQVWAASSAGRVSVLGIDGQWISYKSSKTRYAGQAVQNMAIDLHNQVWLAADPGLEVRLPDGRWAEYTEDNSGWIENSPSALWIDPQGKLWIGTNDGLMVFNPNAALPNSMLSLLAKLQKPAWLALCLAMVGLSLSFVFASCQIESLRSTTALGLGLRWVVANLLGLSGGTTIIILFIVFNVYYLFMILVLPLALLIAGAGVGFMQQQAMQVYIGQNKAWIAATLAGWFAGSLLFTFLYFSGQGVNIVGPAYIATFSVMAFFSGSVNGVLAGVLQWDLLRSRMPHAGWWPLASVTGWALGSALGAPVFLLSSDMPGLLAPMIITTVIFGIITGGALVWLTKEAQSSLSA